MNRPFLSVTSNVESFMLKHFMDLLGGNKSIAAAVYLSLNTQGPKIAAIKAAAKISLAGKPEQLSVLDALLALAKTKAGRVHSSREKSGKTTTGYTSMPMEGAFCFMMAATGGLVNIRLKVKPETKLRLGCMFIHLLTCTIGKMKALHCRLSKTNLVMILSRGASLKDPK